MDELELLKKDWNSKTEDYNQYADADIYPMLRKRSSSIVKTLFYISIAELVFWMIINSIPYFSSEEYRAKLESTYGSSFLMSFLTLISYAVIILFIYFLYKSYKSISVIDNAKTLMKNILKTRKIIKWYVLYNLIMAGLTFIVGMFYAISNNPELSKQFANYSTKQVIASGVFLLGFISIFIIVIWAFYKLIYGWLLKRLNKNYNELKKLEI